MVASYSGHYDCVRELIMQGADINLQREVRQLSLSEVGLDEGLSGRAVCGDIERVLKGAKTCSL